MKRLVIALFNTDYLIAQASALSPFFQRSLEADAEQLPQLAEHLQQPYSEAEMRAFLAGCAISDENSLKRALRQLRRRVMLRVIGGARVETTDLALVAASPLPLWVTLGQLTILLSLNLAMLNLLPLPALDGGRLLFVIIEVLRGGKRLAPEREGLVHVAGLILLLGFMAIVLALDALRIYEGRSFLP